MKIHFDLTVRDLNKLFFGLILVELLLVTGYVLNVLWGSPSWIVTRLVDLDDEGSIATWFSSMQLFVVGLLFFLKAVMPMRLNYLQRPFFVSWGWDSFFYRLMKQRRSMKKSILC